ncbi:MAG: hypothetical protein ACM3PC_04785 [Deltaproteobacteria bacterium]
MLKSVAVACACTLALPMAGRADEMRVVNESAARISHSTPRQSLPDEVVEVQSHRSAGSVIIGDAVGGAALGALAGGGVAAYRNYVQNEGWGNWQRDVLIGAGIGLGVGLIVGVASAASYADRSYMMGPVSDQRVTGFSSSMPVYGAHF